MSIVTRSFLHRFLYYRVARIWLLYRFQPWLIRTLIYIIVLLIVINIMKPITAALWFWITR